MTRKLFGTDGIRGTANQDPMTADIALQVGMAAGYIFRGQGEHKGRSRVLIGKDTRLSGYLIEPALTAGFIAMGMDVMLVGPIPTPAIAMLTRTLRADLGVMISASHNPYYDNGIKLFGPDGYKLSDDQEMKIEEFMENGLHQHRAAPDKLGKAQRIDDATGRYVEFVKSTFPAGLRLDNLKIVVDCANGAAYKVAPAVLWELGADVISIGVEPDGFNINKLCGATDPKTLQSQVITHNADIGIALDGDADRCIMCDQNGDIIDGDQIMAVIAQNWKQNGQLKNNGIVATIMSNFRLEKFLETQKINLIRTQVGDRYVVEQMREGGYNVGGEQSGHILLGDYTTTGDGLIAALQILAVLVKSGKKASDIGNTFTRVPQILKNVNFGNHEPLENADVKKAIQLAEKSLGKNGRLVIRKSGTEPVIRVMVESTNPDQIEPLADQVISAIEKSCA